MHYSLGLIGYPLSHSRSPILHQAALESTGLRGAYTLYPTPPDADHLEAVIDRVRQGDLHGLNVTIPHKRAVIPFLDTLTPAARAIGAVNTIYFRGDALIGGNTDSEGYLRDLARSFPDLLLSEGQSSGKTALVFGAGGSARAVAYGLLKKGFRLLISTRRPEQAHKLRKDFADILPEFDPRHEKPSESRVQVLKFPVEAGIRLGKVDLMVNCTPMGMDPRPETSPWLPDVPYPPGARVYDLVYNPLQTRFVREALTHGLAAVTGSGMLVEQAALAFEIWTGIPAPRKEMYAAFLRG